MTTTIEETLAALKAAEKVATPAPWEAVNVVLGDESRRTQIRVTESHVLAYLFRYADDVPPDAALIAVARNALPALLAEIHLLRAEVERYARDEEDHPTLPYHPLLRPDRKLGEP